MERFDIKTFGSKADSHVKSVFLQICLSIGQVDKDAKAVCAEVHTETMLHEGVGRVTSVGSVSSIPAVPVYTLSHEAVDVPHIRVVEHL